MKCKNLSYYLTFFSVVIFEVSASSSYTPGLIKYLRRESRLHQVMFIVDDHLLQNTSSSADYLIRNVSRRFPSFSTSFTRLRTSLDEHFPPSARPPRRTTLFIMILNGDENYTWAKVLRPLVQLKRLSQRHSYPKCLINFISQKESQSIKQSLEYFWSQDFLDIAVLEHLRENQTSLVLEAGRLPILHEINPFAKTYNANKVSAQTKWFPNKLLNLYRSPIKLGFSVSSGHVGNKWEIKNALKISNIFLMTMHCSVKLVQIESTQVAVVSDVMHQEKIEMILNPVIFKDSIGLSSKNPLIRIMNFENIKAVIPSTSSFFKVLVISKEFIIMLLSTTIVIVTIRITAWILKFNTTTWQTFNISQILMGMSITRESEKSTEKIVFGILMLCCIVYSGYLYSVILDISLQADPEISNLEELANSSLTPLGSPVVKESLLGSPISYLRKLGSKMDFLPTIKTEFDCLAYLTKNINVTCITFERNVNKFKKQSELNGRILSEDVGNFIYSCLARDASPYLDRFNEIILKASEHGLLYRQVYRNYLEQSILSPPEEISKEKLLLIVFYLLVIGYSLAILSFTIELLSCVKWR